MGDTSDSGPENREAWGLICLGWKWGLPQEDKEG